MECGAHSSACLAPPHVHVYLFSCASRVTVWSDAQKPSSDTQLTFNLVPSDPCVQHGATPFKPGGSAWTGLVVVVWVPHLGRAADLHFKPVGSGRHLPTSPLPHPLLLLLVYKQPPLSSRQPGIHRPRGCTLGGRLCLAGLRGASHLPSQVVPLIFVSPLHPSPLPSYHKGSTTMEGN